MGYSQQDHMDGYVFALSLTWVLNHQQGHGAGKFFTSKMFPVPWVPHLKTPSGMSMDWFKGKITGTPHISWENLWFPVDFPLSQSIEYVVAGSRLTMNITSPYFLGRRLY